MYLSVVIPAYNEEKRLPKTLFEIDRYLKTRNYGYEIIVISDGSKDRTSEVVRGLMPQIKSLRLIDNKENHGKGYVVRQGMLAAKGDFRLFMDADNSTSVNQVEKMFPEFEKGFDIVIGSRDVKGADIINPQPWYRQTLGNGFNLLVQIILGLWGIWDTQCGFKGMTVKAANDILPKCKINRWAFDPEILALAKQKKYKIKEVAVRWFNDPDSRVKLRGVAAMFFEVLKIRWNLIIGKYK